MEDGTVESADPFAEALAAGATRRETQDILTGGQSRVNKQQAKTSEIQFKATHGLLVAFLILIL